MMKFHQIMGRTTKMKKITRILSAAFATIALAACQQEMQDNPGDNNLALNQFGATAEVATKVTISSDWKLSWEAGDKTDVFDGATKLVFSAKTSGASTLLDPENADFRREAGKTYYAVYPSSESNSIDGTTITLDVAGDRTAVAGEYPSAPAVASTTGAQANFAFMNVCGLVSFEVAEGQNIASIVIFGGNGENVAGTVKVNALTAEYEVVKGEKEITLTPAEGETFAAGRYYVAVLPQEFTAGLSVSLYAADGTRLRKNLNAFTLGRSSHLDVETGGEFKTEFTIKNADELVAFLALADKCSASTKATLANDIDLAGVTLKPASSYAGTFDGNGKKLMNWTTDGPLFTKVLAGATVKGVVLDASCTLKMKESTSYTQSYVVGLNEGTVSGCTNNADINYTLPEGTVLRKRTFGTIVCSSTGVVSGCHNNGNITITIPQLTYSATDSDEDAYKRWQHQRVGGVVGTFKSTEGTNAVDACTNSGNISYSFLGAAGNLRPFFNIGGICAQGCDENPTPEASATVNYGTMNECVNKGQVSLLFNNIDGSNYANVGGVVGYLEGSLLNCTNDSNATVSFTTDKSNKASAPGIGGVVGSLMCGNIVSCSNKAAVNVVAAIRNGSDNPRGEYIGGFHAASVGGVVGKAGVYTEKSSCKIEDCTNSGAVTSEIYGNYIHTGGIAGWTSIPLVGTAANKLQNSGPITVVKGTLENAYAGGIAGRSKSTYNKAYNTENGSVTVTMDETTGKQARVAGIVAYMEKAADITFKQGINKAPVTLTGGAGQGTSTYYVGGVVAESKATKANSNGTGWADSNSNYGNITVDIPVKLCVGGAVGKIGATTTGDGHTEKCKNRGNITVNAPKSGSCVGGVVGIHGRGRLGYSNNCGTSDDPVNITVTNATSGVYVGGLVGQISTNNGPTYPSCCTTISGFGIYGSISATGATAGIIAGNIKMTGASTTNGIMINTSGQNVKIAKDVKLNGVEKGDLSKNTDLSTFIASITPSSETTRTKNDDEENPTPLKNTYYICANSGTTEASFPYGFTNY